MLSRHSFAHPCGSAFPAGRWGTPEMSLEEAVLRGAGLHFFLAPGVPAGVPGSWDSNKLLRTGTHPASQGTLVPAAD